jgi:hypothetical protein
MAQPSSAKANAIARPIRCPVPVIKAERVVAFGMRVPWVNRSEIARILGRAGFRT